MPSPKVLAVYYSQTGQLRAVLDAFLEPFEAAGWEVTRRPLRPEPEYAFPWSVRSLVEAVSNILSRRTGRIAPGPSHSDVDLVVLGYSVWFFAPSLPVLAYLEEEGPSLRRKPVATVISCRNMWYSAELGLRRILADVGAKPIGTVVATDQGPTWSTLVTTPRWILTGRSDAFLGVFSPVGVSAGRIDAIRGLGRTFVANWQHGRESEILTGPQAHEIECDVAFVDVVGAWLGAIWGKIFKRTRSIHALDSIARLVFSVFFAIGVPVGVVALRIVHRAFPRPINSFVEKKTSPLRSVAD